jgi:hypothetical protein
MKTIISKRGRAPDQSREQVEEIFRCAKDPIYFIKNYFQYLHPKMGAMPLPLHPYQEDYIRHMLRNDMVVSMAPRQVGMTTVAIAFMLWEAIFHDCKSEVFGTVTNSMAASASEIANFAVSKLPTFLMPKVRYSSKDEIVFENSSRILFRAASTRAVRGMAISRLHLDNFAFLSPSDQQNIAMLMLPVLTSCGVAFSIHSTPNGKHNMFAKIWTEANKGANLFAPFKVDFADVQWDQAVKDLIKQSISDYAWREQYQCEFL